MDQYKDIYTETKLILKRYPTKRAAVMSLLYLVQSVDGYIKESGIEYVGTIVGLEKAEVESIASFYSMYRREQVGDFLVGICINTLCGVLGGELLYEAILKYINENNMKGRVTLERLECNAACDYAPVMLINWQFIDRCSIERARSILDRLMKNEKVFSDRGDEILTFKRTCKLFAMGKDYLSVDSKKATD